MGDGEMLSNCDMGGDLISFVPNPLFPEATQNIKYMFDFRAYTM